MEVWSVGVGVYIVRLYMSSVPPPSPRVDVGGGLKEETPCSMYTCVAILDHNHTAWEVCCVINYLHLVKLVSEQV